MSSPVEHFRTAATTGGLLAGLVEGILRERVDLCAVVDIGAGGGELLTALARRRPDLRLAGVDLRTRPAGLDAGVGWAQDRWDVRRHTWTSGEVVDLLARLPGPVLLVAAEWLDDLPCRWVRWADGCWLEVMVSSDGTTYAGPPLVDEELAWAQRWWPVGDQAEIGLTRDRAWTDLVAGARATGGAALLVDYGHDLSSRPTAGSLAGYGSGRRLPATLDPSVNLTAHVAVDSARAAGETLGAQTSFAGTLAELVESMDPSQHRPTPADPLAALVTRSHRSALRSPRVWGSFRALLQG
ncbi:MAG TPA: SAM-dependent methyltransferase [Propionibacteriaceae bacterium]